MTQRFTDATHPFFQLPLLLLLVLALAAGGSTDVLAQEAPPAPALATSLDPLLLAINQARQEAGLAPLVLQPALLQAAQRQAADLAAGTAFGHIGSDGSSVAQRAATAGYASRLGVSENWVNTHSADAAVAWWLSDTIHRINMLNGKWTDVGVSAQADGSGLTIFVAVFGAGNDGDAAAVLAAAQPVVVRADAPAAGGDYIVQPGDTLLSIGLRHGLAWQSIAQANELSEHSLLQIGQRLTLPGYGGEGPVGGPVEAPPPDAAGRGETYIVQPGDTLVSIAAVYGWSWQELAAANGLGEDDLLQIGQRLRLSRSTSAPATSGAGAALRVYLVQGGDTIIDIALRHGVDWRELLALNGLDEESVLQVGQRIEVP